MAAPIRPASAFRLLLAAAAVLAVAVVAGLLSRGPAPASANPLEGVVAVGAGVTHTCALLDDGGVKCWGRNPKGQLGNGTVVNSSVPVAVLTLAGDATALSVGESHACVITMSAGVKCWGWNFYRQVADIPSGAVTVPLAVAGVSNVVAVGAGSLDTCVATGTGSVMCWGNLFGPPSPVAGFANIVAVTVGGNHFCGLTAAGGAKCGGFNAYGQLGNGSAANVFGPVVDVLGLTSGVAQIEAGVAHTCAVTAGGGVKCWGGNQQGQLGDGTVVERHAPVDVVGLAAGVASVSTMIYQTCALLVSGGVKCWGGGFGPVPVDVPGLESGIASVSAGGAHICALTTAGGVKCVGANTFGQLGDGTTNSSVLPVDVVVSQVKPTATPTACPGVCPSATPSPTPAVCPAGPVCMKLRVSQGAISCPEGGGARVCVPAGSKFKLAVDVVRAPAAGYILLQTQIKFGTYDPAASEDGAGPDTCGDGLANGPGDSFDQFDSDCASITLAYKKAAAPAQEFLWPDLGSFVVRSQLAGLVNHSGLSGYVSFPISYYVGPAVEVSMNCQETPSSTDVALLPLSPQNGNGSGFVEPNGVTQWGAADTLTIDCVPLPTPTVTPTATPTPLPLGGSGAYPDVASKGGIPFASVLAGATAGALLLAALAWRVRAAR